MKCSFKQSVCRISAAAIVAMLPLLAVAQTIDSPYELVGVTGYGTPCPAGTIGDPNVKCWPINSGTPTTEGPATTNPSGEDYTGSSGYNENPPPPSCDGKHPILADDNVERGLNYLWDSGSGDATALGDRKEAVGWLVKTATGYRIHAWPVTSPDYRGWCTGDLSAVAQSSIPPEGPGAIIAFVHTHPYAAGDWKQDCNGNFGTYPGGPSKEDMDASKALGSMLGRPGALQGYVLDRDKITSFWGDLIGTIDTPRCGY